MAAHMHRLIKKTIAGGSWSACILSSFQVAQIRKEVLVIKFIMYTRRNFHMFGLDSWPTYKTAKDPKCSIYNTFCMQCNKQYTQSL